MSDFMASIAIMGATLALFAAMWNIGVDSQTRFREDEQLKDRAERTVDYMVTTSGYPENWEESGNLDVPGFAVSQNILSLDKIEAFNDLTYEEKKDHVKTQEFALEFRNESGETMDYEGLTGETPASDPFDQGEEVPNDALTVVKADRSAAINISGEMVATEVNFIAWR